MKNKKVKRKKGTYTSWSNKNRKPWKV